LKETFQKNLNEKLNVIQCAIFLRGETNMAVSFAVLIVNIFFMTYACSYTTRISFPQQQLHSDPFCVTTDRKQEKQTTVLKKCHLLMIVTVI
jgi:hypothetical protein